ncbi:hypothetical protein [Bradyrhizobium valentinum]|uniref:hypothetical protein n=1 Tax=Bradyrhizobium valentinum TaxID=1518501 RepID=UPI001FDA5A29|nr:hypothetical protein [Bradyrhizobium valentinum]
MAFGEVGFACDTPDRFESDLFAGACPSSEALWPKAGAKQASAHSDTASGIKRRRASGFFSNIGSPVLS